MIQDGYLQLKCDLQQEFMIQVKIFPLETLILKNASFTVCHLKHWTETFMRFFQHLSVFIHLWTKWKWTFCLCYSINDWWTHTHAVWLSLTQEAGWHVDGRVIHDGVCRDGGRFIVRDSTFLRSPLLRSAWSPPLRTQRASWSENNGQRATEWDRRRLGLKSVEWIYLNKAESDVFVKLFAMLWTVECRYRDCC